MALGLEGFMKDLEPSIPSSEERLAHRIIEQIHHSELYESYERAFVETTGLSLRLASADGRLIAGGSHHKNRFCELLSRQNKSSEICARACRNVTLFGERDPHTSTCFAGLCESCVPIRTGGRTIGYLLTGGIATTRPTQARFAKIIEWLRGSGLEFNESQLRRAFFSTRILSHKQYESILELLHVFAGHLALISGQLLLHGEHSESPDINRAREFIQQHLTEPLDLQQVAGSANLSACYFCRKFKESTGTTFTSYLARTRVEAAKKMLVNPQVRVSEVAFEVGFQSLTHFNRVFKEIAGSSPTRYRRELPGSTLNQTGDSAPKPSAGPFPSGNKAVETARPLA
jgi:AraC-like DNA-binding protein/ligand-binding sensor protein